MQANAVFARLLFIVLVLLLGTQTQAQQAKYIYIQSENNQPYYVRLKGNTYGSSASGYLLVPQLASGDYTIRLGFPRSAVEYSFNFTIGQEDRGFSLKLGVDNNWSLFDMVSFNVIKGTVATDIEKADAPVAEAAPVKEIVPVKKEKSATERPPAEKPAVEKPVTIPSAAVTETASQPVPKKPAVTGIRKIYEKTGADGVDLVYVVPNGSRADTVILFVPHTVK